MGEGDVKNDAAISLGLQDRGRRPPELRKQVAIRRGVAPATLKKGYEPVMFADLASSILALLITQQPTDKPSVIEASQPSGIDLPSVADAPQRVEATERHHFTDPIDMYPFVVERALSIEDLGQRTLDVLGITLYTAWTSLKFWVMRPETTDWTVRMAAVMDRTSAMSPWIPGLWQKEAEIHLEDIFETAQLRDVTARRIQLRPYAYDFVPGVHGYRLGNGDLFISFLRWQADGRLGKHGYTYEYISGEEQSASATSFRELFDSWFERAMTVGQFFPGQT